MVSHSLLVLGTELRFFGRQYLLSITELSLQPRDLKTPFPPLSTFLPGEERQACAMDLLQEVLLAFCHVGAKDGTQVGRRGASFFTC